jgi:MSHA biogenesis protein MshE
MRIEMEQLKMFLIDSSILPKEQVEEVVKEAKSAEKDLGTLLLEKKLVKEAELQRMYAYILGIPFVDLSKEAVPIEILQVVPELIAKIQHCFFSEIW